jgi:cell division GTPase FtsZ
VLVGSAVEAVSTAELARRLKAAGVPVCAVLASPFAFEGGRKAVAAAEVLRSLASAVDLLVVVDQERLMQDAVSGMTLTVATQAADGVLRGATECMCRMMGCDVHVFRRADGHTEVVRGPFARELQRFAIPEAPAAFGRGSARFAASSGDSAAAAAITAAAFSAASTQFLSHIRASPALACFCVVRTSPGLSAGVLEVAAQALSSLLPNCPLLLTYTPDASSDGELEVGLFVVSATASASSAPRGTAPAATDKQTQRKWTAMAGLAGGAKEPRPPVAHVAVAAAQPLPPLPLPPSAPAPSVLQAPLPATSRTNSAIAGPLQAAGQLPHVMLDTPAASPVPPSSAARVEEAGRSFLRFWGLQKPRAKSISERASAVLASDRAASRVIVRLSYPDGSSYEGEMLDGKEHGKGRRVYANGSWYAGSFENGLRHGWGVAVTGSERFEGEWMHGAPAGEASEQQQQR